MLVKKAVERYCKIQANGFTAGIPVAKGTIGDMRKNQSETLTMGEPFREFKAATEFRIESQVETAGGIIIAAAELGGEYPAMTEFEIDQNAESSIELMVLAGAAGQPWTELKKAEGGAVFKIPVYFLVAVQ